MAEAAGPGDAANVWAFGPQASLAAGFLHPPNPEPLLPRDPERVGGYTLVGRLGVGGMGVAYLARDDAGREAALKLVHPNLAEHEEFRARFIREVAAARRVPGRHTARVLDADVLADPPWLATEYFRCWTLAQQVPRFGPLTVENVGTLITRLAEALAAMHAAGLVHRDLKPSNILLAPDGPRIIDFGIARAADLESLTATGRLPGTPGFMAPEQIEGRETGPPADVFALGASLVYATTGTSPFWDGSPTTLMYRTVHAEPDLGTMPEELREVTLRCLAKEAGERPTAAELVAEFGGGADEVAGGYGDSATDEGNEPRSAAQLPAVSAERVMVGEAHAASTERIVVGGANEASSEQNVVGEANDASTERIVVGGVTAAESRQNVGFPPPVRRPRTGLVIGASVGGLVAAVAVALALATNSGSAASPHTSTTSRSPTTSQSPTTSRSGSAIPSRTATPPPLPHSLVGYSGRLVGQNLAWFESLRIPASSAPWSGGGLWSAIAGPGCPDGTGHSLQATGWSTDSARGGATFGGCDAADLVASTVPPGNPATSRITWTFTPGPSVSACALFAYNATSSANLAFGDYSIGGRAGQFPISGTSHAGEWIELGVASPTSTSTPSATEPAATTTGTITVGLANDQAGDVQHPAAPTVTAAQVVAVCGGPST